MKLKHLVISAMLLGFVLLVGRTAMAQEDEKARPFAVKLGYMTSTCDGCEALKGYSLAVSYLATPDKKNSFEVGLAYSPLSFSESGVTLNVKFLDLSASYLFRFGDSPNSPYAGPSLIYSKADISASGFGESINLGSSSGTGFGVVLGTKFGGRALGEIRWSSIKYEGKFKNLGFYAGYTF